MTMNCYLTFLTLFFGLSIVQMHPIEKRRIKKLNVDITVDELRRQCIEHGWDTCRSDIDALSSSMLDLDLCITEEKSTVVVYDQKKSCRSNKRAARTAYCELVRDIAKYTEHHLKFMGWLLKCTPRLMEVDVDIESEFTPQEILDLLKTWLSKTVNLHRSSSKCSTCNSTLENFPRIIDNSYQCPPPGYEIKYDYALNSWQIGISSMAQLMKANERLLNELSPSSIKCQGKCMKPGVAECISYHI